MENWLDREFGHLVGKTIAEFRLLGKKECEQLCWDEHTHGQAFYIIFTDGTVALPSQDPEGNGPGFIFTL